jgi:hypothetical protein
MPQVLPPSCLKNSSASVSLSAPPYLLRYECNVAAFHEVLGTTSQEGLDSSPTISLNSRIIVAKAALKHIIQKEEEIAQIVSSVIPGANYVLQAGFNEFLIQKGHHLQEIYLFVNTSIPLNSPIFELLGKAFSPFPGVVQMPTTNQLTAVFNKDGIEYDRDSLFLSQTERFHKDDLLLVGAVSKCDAIHLDQEAPTQSSGNGGNVNRKTEGGPPGNGEASSGTGQTPSGCRQFLSGGRQTPSGRQDEELPPPGVPRAYFDATARIYTIEAKDEAKESYTLQITGELTSTVVRISFSPVVSVLTFNSHKDELQVYNFKNWTFRATLTSKTLLIYAS